MEGVRNVLKGSELNKSVKERAFQETFLGKYEVLRGGVVESKETEWEMFRDIVKQSTYLDTWSGFEAAKTVPRPSRGLHHFGKFLEPSDELAGRGCFCFLMR